MAPYIQFRTQNKMEHALTACCYPAQPDPSKNPTPTETSSGLPKPCNYSILWLTTPARQDIPALESRALQFPKGFIISDVLHLTWNKALLLPAGYRVQPSQLCLRTRTNLHAKLKKQFDCWLSWSSLWFPLPWHGSILPLKHIFPHKHHWGKHCYGEEKLKGITISRVNLDRVTQPLEQS